MWEKIWKGFNDVCEEVLGVGKEWFSYSHVLVMCLLLPVQMTTYFYIDVCE